MDLVECAKYPWCSKNKGLPSFMDLRWVMKIKQEFDDDGRGQVKRNRKDVYKLCRWFIFHLIFHSTSIYQIYFMYQKLCTMPGQIAINSMSSNPTLRAFRFKWMRQTLNEQLHIYLYHTLEYYFV